VGLSVQGYPPVLFHQRHAGKEMTKIAVQIYEIQDPWEAENMIELGVDHLGKGKGTLVRK